MRYSIVIAAALFFAATPSAVSETVQIKFGGAEDLARFDCRPAASRFVARVCYRADDHRLIVRLHETYYSYCDVPSDVVRGLREAEMPGRYYVAHIKAPSPFDCRLAPRMTAAEPAALARPPVPAFVSMVCRDGSLSHAAHRSGACSHHGGLRD